MFGVGLPELVFIFIVILIVFGPEKLPEMAQSLGKFLGTIKKSTDSVRQEFHEAIYSPGKDFKNALLDEEDQSSADKPDQSEEQTKKTE